MEKRTKGGNGNNEGSKKLIRISRMGARNKMFRMWDGLKKESLGVNNVQCHHYTHTALDNGNLRRRGVTAPTGADIYCFPCICTLHARHKQY